MRDDPSNQTKILVVDDERAIVEALTRAFGAAGFACDGHSNSTEALSAIQNFDYDVVITDLRMPVMHGHMLINKILELDRLPLIVVVTAVADPRIEMDLYTRGVAEVAFKPVNYDRLIAKVRALLKLQGTPGGESRTDSDSVAVRTARQLTQVRAELEGQLNSIQSNFKQTIDRLVKQESELEENYLGSVRILANLIEAGQVSEGSHSARVESMAGRLAEHCGIEGLQLRGLKVAALLHEIGQFGLADKIRVVPPWELSGESRIAYESYPMIGATLLSQVPGSQDIANWVESHAENYDGTGFPEKLSGKSIHLCARVLRIADGLDTFLMFSQDPRPKQEIAKEHLKENIGFCYDPDLAKKAIRILDNVLPESKKSKVEKIPANKTVPGMVLAKDVYDRSGICLVRKGMTITGSLVHRLHKGLMSKPVEVYAEESD
ncbi:MAG: response regulator [Candidatus Omnitrophica bacterium]|nr:response regulator [Candidatus Omnitrophota bacterium]MCB9768969.1 response regulator [Candidatus Omnitrophota bacterium]MCB9782433.1 response regulator [Candidatus Omnitrophota bacterium]